MTEARRGFGFGVAAYVLWGGFPLYFPLLEPTSAVEILAHRILWSCLTMAVLVVLLRRSRQLRTLLRDRRRLGWLTAAAILIAVNWGTFIWGVNNGHVVETSLGYFVNPLVTVLIGVLVLQERLRPLQWLAMGVAATAVLVISVDYGRLPWVALVLACSFGTYGLAKKRADAGAIESLAFETAVLAPFAGAFLAWLVWQGASDFGQHGAWHVLLLMSTGIITAVPLLCFGGAATRVSMVTLGLLQYLTPILQFTLGVAWFGEEMPLARWIGFALVWAALAVFTMEAINHRRKQLRLAAEAAAL